MIGRDDSCAISIPDGRISRRHLQIVFEGGADRYVAVDVGSSNGVIVNGERLERGAERVLEDGDEISIGSSCLRYSEAEPGQVNPAASSLGAAASDPSMMRDGSDATHPG